MAQRALRGDGRLVRYIGFLQAKQFNQTATAIRHSVYQHWDDSRVAPPKQRPADETESDTVPTLEILGWSQDRPHWPPTSLFESKFEAGSAEMKAITEKKAAFEAAFPPAPAPTSAGPAEVGRAGGLCDYTIDQRPLSLDRDVSLAVVADADMREGRRGLRTQLVY